MSHTCISLSLSLSLDPAMNNLHYPTLRFGFEDVLKKVPHHLMPGRNPLAVSTLCCLVGVALSVISILSIVGVARLGDGENWSPRDSLQMFYQCIFGFVLVLIDMREQWANYCLGLQTKLFTYCNFLASQTGRALFYFYVGSISIFLWPSSDFWKIVPRMSLNRGRGNMAELVQSYIYIMISEWLSGFIC